MGMVQWQCVKERNSGVEMGGASGPVAMLRAVAVRCREGGGRIQDLATQQRGSLSHTTASLLLLLPDHSCFPCPLFSFFLSTSLLLLLFLIPFPPPPFHSPIHSPQGNTDPFSYFALRCSAPRALSASSTMNVTEKPTHLKMNDMPIPPSTTTVPAHEYYANANYVSRHRTLGSVSLLPLPSPPSYPPFRSEAVVMSSCSAYLSSSAPSRNGLI